MTKVINLLAGPSAGKSTNAYLLTGMLKQRRINAEFAGEAAKDEVWRNPGFAHIRLNDQIALFAEQNTRIYALVDQVDYVVTDGCLLQGLIYIQGSHTKFKTNKNAWDSSFMDFVVKTYNQYDNINYFIDRGDRKFIQDGRIHTEEQSKEKDTETIDMLEMLRFPYKIVKSAEEILKDLESEKSPN